MTRRYKALLLVVFCAFGNALHAQTKIKEESHNVRQDELKVVVVLSRHGVRSPTWTLEQLNKYSSLPWPAWSVPPGYLTAHGFALMKLFGAYDRASLAKAGLFANQGCSAAAATYIWADTEQRTLQSARALADGLFPGCTTEVHSLGEGENDPLFHSHPAEADPAEADIAFARISKGLADLQTSDYGEAITQMRRVLLGCDVNADCTPQRRPEIPLVDSKDSAVKGTGDHVVTLKGPLAEAASFAEDFLLEYSEGMPLPLVGWGKVDETQIDRFIALHSSYFDLVHRTPLLAKMEASGMLNRILFTLQQGVDSKPIDGAIGPPGAKLVLLAGHDTNIGAVAALLGLHWNLDGRADDTPPGTELVFELWQTPQGEFRVSERIAMQTLLQMRELQTLTLENPPAQQNFVLSSCGARQASCSWAEFRSAVETAVGKR